MDENNKNDMGTQPKKENPFKNWLFYMAYVITISIIGVAIWFLTEGFTAYLWILGASMLSILSVVIGLSAWAIVRKSSRAIALGILLGSLTPFVAVFVGTGSCIGFW